MDAKKTVQSRLKELGMTQAQLATCLGTTPAILSRTLGSPMIRPDSHWPAILDALGLQVELVSTSRKDTDGQEG